MSREKFKCVLVSDFTINNFAGYLDNDEEKPFVESIVAPFGQVAQILTDEGSRHWKTNPDFAIIWTRPEGVSAAFRQALEYKKTEMRDILKEVDEYSSFLLNIRKRAGFAFVPSWTSPSYHRGLGMLDMKAETGIANILMRMNLRLAENLAKEPDYYLLNTQKWIEAAGTKAFNPKLWYMGKIAFGNEVFMEAVKDIKSALRGTTGNSKKIVILDLDDTLWGGIVGDIGLENIKLGGHDHIGEAYRDFQSALKALTNRGILLGIISKNEEPVALEAIERHPEMVLKSGDFAGWRINWKDKVENIIELVSDLNLGLQSVVFIDDNPAERSRVREALPEVLVPEWPDDPMFYKSALLGLRCFDSPSISEEDIKRNEMYTSERRRNKLKCNFDSVNEWLKSLKINIKVKEFNKANSQRTTQLFNKTNQMNLTTRRMTETEISDWAVQKGHKLWTFRVSDKFGDSGITGIVSLETDGKNGNIADFILSCRVMGRKVEEAMLYTVVKYAQSAGLKNVRARYVPTSKNKPCLTFFERSGFERTENYVFSWKVRKIYPIPGYIKLKRS